MTLHTSPHSKAILTLADFKPPEPMLHDILVAVSTVTGINLRDLTGPWRGMAHIRARAIYFGLARSLTSKSFPNIGRHCGNRDHTTVMNGYKQFKLKRAADEDFNRAVEAVEKLLSPK